ncbi:MAG: LysM peptidoglycan-binding domain-containing protein [Clostridiales bacterium]|nr:LysM peptidoglycan-binding domain-containing protein [Clostridiales bacterium]
MLFLKRKWTCLLSLVLFITLLFIPLSATAEATTITYRYTYQYTANGWRLVSSPTTTTTTRITYAYYRIQSGDTLVSISQRFKTTVAELKRLNNLTSDALYAGRLLLVPLTSQPATAPQPAPAPTPIPAPAPVAPAPEQNVSGLTQAEQQMLNLVNYERTSRGLRPLQADMELTRLARLKSQDMINLNYFAHQSPTYGSPFDMMRAAGVTYRTAGENLAGAPTVERAHTGLMNSPGHRANILNPNFTHIGIGAITGGRYGMMFTQMFVGR